MVSKKPPNLSIVLDGKPVDFISAFLFPKGGHDNPAKLRANEGKSFIGSYVLGMGFTFDDTNPDATPLAEMHRLIEKDSRNRERIFPYIGGDEVNNSPTHAHHRYVINFGELTEDEAREYPDLMAILEKKVKPERDKQKRDSNRIYWWQYAEKRPGLMKAIESLDRVLVNALYGVHLSFVFLPKRMVFANKLNVMPFDQYCSFSLLQNRVHEIWARFFSSTLKDDLAYAPSDCFETFPFPPNWETNPELETIGKTYYEYRAQLMVQNNQGLTDTYNRFHAPDEDNPDILKLRQLHAEMDKAVLAAYGWDDINPTCEFLLDYKEEEDTLTPSPSPIEGEGNQNFLPPSPLVGEGLGMRGKSNRKKPYRYRWTEDTHDEVLTRLLALNKERAQAVGKKAGAKKTKKKAASKSDKPQAIISSKQLSLIQPDAEQLEL